MNHIRAISASLAQSLRDNWDSYFGSLFGETRMNAVRVKKVELLDILRTNRAMHAHGYKAAVDGYRQTALAAADVAFTRMRRRIEKLRSGEVVAMASIRFDLAPPENHTEDYDRAIKMLEMSVDEVVDLDARSFESLVNDNWAWKKHTILGWDGYNISSVGFLGKDPDRLVESED